MKIMKIFSIIILFLLASFSFLPIIVSFGTSFMTLEESYKVPPKIFPTNPVLSNWIRLFSLEEITGELTETYEYGKEARSGRILIDNLFNSILISLTTAFTSILISIPVVYITIRFKFRGYSLIPLSALLIYMFPSIILIVPVYILDVNLGLIDTYVGLLIPYLILTVPFIVWFLRAYFINFPWELEEAALIDGCSRLRALYEVILWLALPGLITAWLYAFVMAWGEFNFALIITGSSTKTVPIKLLQFVQQHHVNWPVLMAGCLIYSFPIIIIFYAIEKYFIAGLLTGSIKG